MLSIGTFGCFNVTASLAYLSKLNPEQRRAAEHGVGKGMKAGPLLVIAGAGSGKTNTLAHRVAHLIINGADPRRILLMTFSRRAASEMTRRVERICTEALGDKAGILAEGITWAGTFHAIGAKLLRDYAVQIGLDPAFTIHDREDSADLMNLVRHELGYSKTAARFPTKGTCLQIYSRCVNTELPLDDRFSLAPMSKPSSGRTCSITMTCFSTGLRSSPTQTLRRRLAAFSITSWSTNIRIPTGCNHPSCLA
jgi:DNA helicase-2/ATP-dependent DNA helicase PcrA